MKTRKLIKRIAALPLVTYILVQAIVCMVLCAPISIAHWLWTEDRWHYTTYKVCGTWFDCFSPYWADCLVIVNSRFDRMVEDIVNRLWL